MALETMRAEITRLMAETTKINDEREKPPLVIEELRARVDKTVRQTTLYPFIVGASVTLAFVAVVKLFL